MQKFALALAALYDLAEQASHNDFPDGALKLLQPWVGFDDAIFWSGDADGEAPHKPADARAYFHWHGGEHEQARLPAADVYLPAMSAAVQPLLRGMKQPLLRDCRSHPLQRQADCPYLQECRHLMLFGENAGPDKSGRWLLLFRRRDDPFTADEAEYLYVAWFHLVRSLDINLSRVLDRHDSERLQRASALVDAQGFVIAADAHFHRLLQIEWPEYRRNRLMQSALVCLTRGGSVYQGRHIVIAMKHEANYTSCRARALHTLAGLTMSEYTVARCFANGLTHKAIARATGRSPNTVRNQIARLYDKLGVNNKAALAQHFAEHLSHRKGGE